jgi:hypothetical protein
VEELIAQIEAVIEAVSAGELSAELDQVAWLRGVVVGLRSATDWAVPLL